MIIDVRELIHTLLTAPHAFLGITPDPPSPPTSPPCAMISAADRSLNGFHFALEGARAEWPDAGPMVIVGSNVIVHQITSQQIDKGVSLPYSPGIERLADPTVVFSFDNSPEPPPKPISGEDVVANDRANRANVGTHQHNVVWRGRD